MGLSRLDNFLKSTRGTIIYVDPGSLDSTDSIENQGNSLTRPFKTIQRALVEAARFSYQRGLDNDRFDKTTIILYPGEHIVDNRPGWIPDGSNNYRLRSSATSSDLPPFDLSTNFDLTTENNTLYKLNSIHGGVIVPRGTSIVGMDLRKTKIRPKYVPNPENASIERSCVFRVTGACYFWQFTILDADPNGICYKDYTANTFVPNFSHHKLAGFEYADGVNSVSINDDFQTYSTDRTDLDMYYEKIGLVYGQASGREIQPDYPSSSLDIQPVVDEYRIVGSRGTEVGISSIRAGDGATPTTTITVTFSESTDQFNVDTPIQINNISDIGYSGQFTVSNVLSSTEIQYEVQNAPLVALPSATGATVNIAVDTVTSASPYIFNISLRSVWGMCGLLSDGSKASGFKSMVVAQYTGIGLQKDDNAFVKYDSTTGTYLDSSSVDNLHSDSRARFKPAYENFHIKAVNNAYLQLVSVFAIGFAEHFSVDSGGDFSINNSNSNFGAKALSATGFRAQAFPQDDIGYITHIIPPKEIESSEVSIDYLGIDVSKTVGIASTSRLYFYNETNFDAPPPGLVDGYRIGARKDDRLYVQLSESGITTNYSARIIMPNTAYTAYEATSQKSFTVGRSATGINSISGNTLTLTSIHSFINGESIRIISDNGALPDGVDDNSIYYAITDSIASIGTNQIQIAQTLNDAINNNPSTLNSNGGVLTIVSRVSDKNPGDIGHPIGFDTSQNNWYINVGTASTDNDVYSKIVGLGVTVLGDSTPRTYFKRKQDTRGFIDTVYRVRYVIPKDSSTLARPPLDGYIIQESNNTLGAGTTEIQKYFSTTTQTLSNSTELRNPRFIANANWSSGTANILTELPHNLIIGSEVEIVNVKSTNNSAGVANSAYNGTFTVTGISSTKQFSYSLTNNPGTFTNDTSTRDSNLPRFNHKKLTGNYSIYRSQEIQEYIPNLQDGIYHVVVVNSSNAPSVAPFTNRKFSQPVQYLYPQTNRDTPESDPKAAKSFASPNIIGKVVVDNPQNSITKETIEKTFADFTVGFGITNIRSSSGVAHTLYTSIDHGLCGITSAIVINGGSSYVEGTYYNVKLVGVSTGVNATARITVGAAGTVTSIKIMDGGSVYGIGNTLSLVGVGTVGSDALVQVTNIYNNVGDSLSISGVSSASFAGYNTLYRITGITTAKEINVESSESVGTFSANVGSSAVANANVVLTGNTLNVSAFTYNNITGVGIVTFTSSHGLLVNNKLRIAGFTSSLYNGDFIVKKINSLTSANLNIGISTISPAVSGTAIGYRPALTSYGGDLNISNESNSGRLVVEYAGITTTLGSTVLASTLDTTPINIPNAPTLGLNIGDYLMIDSEIFRIKTTVTDNSVYIFRGLFGTRRETHSAGSLVRRIKVIPVELRRNSIIRASGHTFEYLGFGPGNYSTAFPERQDRIISNQETLLAQSVKSDGGVSIYTGMDDKGNFYTGNRKVNSATGQEEVYEAPIPTVTGEDPTTGGVNVGFDVLSPLEISVNRSIRVEGGPNGDLISEFDGPVIFNEKITSTSPKGIEAKSVSLGGDLDVSRRLTVGISTPSLAGNPGDVVNNAYPNSGGHFGWVYTNQNRWEKYGRIGNPTLEYSIGVSTVGGPIGITTLLQFTTGAAAGLTINRQYDAISGVTTLSFDGIPPVTIGISTGTNNTYAGIVTQFNFVGVALSIKATTPNANGIGTVIFDNSRLAQGLFDNDITVPRHAIIGGITTLGSDLRVGGNVTVSGISTFTGAVNGSRLNLSSDANISGITTASKFVKYTGIGTYFLKANGDDALLTYQEVINALGYVPSTATVVSNYPQGNSIVLDDIASQFNGSTTDFTMKYGGVAYVPFGSVANLIVSIGGVIQKPGLDYIIVQSGTANTSTLRFTTAPTSGLSCFIVSLGGQGILLQDPAWDAKGDLIAGIADNSAARLPVGSNNSVLTADNSTATGLSWKQSINITGSITGASLSAGSGSISGGSITGTSLSAGSGSISGGSITGTSLSASGGSISGGSITGTSLNVGGGSITGGSISISGNTTLGNASDDTTTVNGTLSVTGSITGASLSAGSGSISGGSITASSQFVGNGTIPVGGIIMWSGSIANIPTGWALCNGLSGTPDLRNRFIVGAHSGSGTGTVTQSGPEIRPILGGINQDYEPGDIGGLSGVSLTIDEMPSHTHTYSSATTGENCVVGGGRAVEAQTQNTGSAGGNRYHENRPPYYSLAFIMRIS